MQALLPGIGILTVSELTRQLRQTLEAQYPSLWVEGQISNLRTPASGHSYFTLKDESSQIRVVLFRGAGQRLPFQLAEGLEVTIRGNVTVYEARGEYQIIAETVVPKGKGSLQLAFEQLRDRLMAEGLFHDARKQPLPAFPERIGLVTSPTGAAIRDIVSILSRRYPVASVLLAPVVVQGDEAAGQIVRAIDDMNQHRQVDVLIVGRGGGSLEDLWAFNQEIVVRAIAQSRIPVISAVGHETDVTLSDFAADVRAATPSAAAEVAVPDIQDVRAQLGHLRHRLRRGMDARLRDCRYDYVRTQQLLPHPRAWLQQYTQHLDALELRLYEGVRHVQDALHAAVLALEAKVHAATPRHHVRMAQQVIPQLKVRLRQAVRRFLDEQRGHVQGGAALLHHLSPLAIVARGYGIVEHETSCEVVKSVRQVCVGTRVKIRMADGRLRCRVEDVQGEPEGAGYASSGMASLQVRGMG